MSRFMHPHPKSTGMHSNKYSVIELPLLNTLFFGQNSVSWSSNKQRTIARSSTEVEYRVVASALAETDW
uniref:Uncharacterized protein n=1 Tax=Solanum lycopersicum TaxID=4081 RepID=A0A3Q7H9H5_SOLLC